MKIKATARVQLTIELETSAPWGEECTIGQLQKQAADEAILRTQKLILESKARLIGEPQVIGVITSTEK